MKFVGLKHLSITEEYHDATAELLQRLDIPNASLEVVYQVDDLEMPTEDFLQRFQWFAEFQSRSWKGTRDVSFNCRDTACGDFIAITIHSTPNRWFKFGIEHLSEKFGFDPVICASQYLALEDMQNMCFDQVSLDGLASLGPLYRLKTLELEKGPRDFVEWAVSSSRELFPSVTQLIVGGVSYSGFEDFINRHGDDEMTLSDDDASVDSDSEDSVDISTE
ncbi:hypothetical protein BDN72DRAFT_901794 [Pluteus cervinus]|uniref:Uncharacterized protein n=1 Tax=Pluteus cervinus TaxID=181527 RepID=A0ACD3AE03_9AGAR|nr:hypothetical protein BDN72DRAFT_901794 [Pluteus cervinus]